MELVIVGHGELDHTGVFLYLIENPKRSRDQSRRMIQIP
jgi:hypothetical protein